MPQLSQDERPWDPVQDVAADFEVCARRAIECLLNRPTMLCKAFRLRAQTAAETGIRCIIESGNRDNALVVSLGLSESDLRSLFSGETNGEMGLDAIGEIVNIIAGNLLGRPAFLSRFGRMRASVPSFAAPGLDMGPARIIRGVLIVGAAQLILELAVISSISGGKE